MKPAKMSLANMQGKMNRKEMKELMTGSGGGGWCSATASCTGGTKITCECNGELCSCDGVEYVSVACIYYGIPYTNDTRFCPF